jgi:hypothetical protein
MPTLDLTNDEARLLFNAWIRSTKGSRADIRLICEKGYDTLSNKMYRVGADVVNG